MFLESRFSHALLLVFALTLPVSCCFAEDDLREILRNQPAVGSGAVATSEILITRPASDTEFPLTSPTASATQSETQSVPAALPKFTITLVSNGGNLASLITQLNEILRAWVNGLQTKPTRPIPLPKPQVKPRPVSSRAAATTTPAAVASSPKPGAKGGKALMAWLQQAGLTGEKLRTAWAIAMRESRGNPKVHNGNRRTGDNSYGLFQINMLGSMGPARRKLFGIKSDKELLDPIVNCRAMMKLSKNGKDFGPWGVGPNAYRHSSSLNATFRKYYNQFPPK